MNRDQWYQLLIRHNVVNDEIVRLLGKLADDEDLTVWGDRLEGLVMCCAVVASQIDSTRKDTPNAI